MAYNSTAWTTDGNTQSVGAATLYKEFGLFDFSPTAGRHNTMVSMNSVAIQGGESYESNDIGGTGTDPVTSLDVSEDAESVRSLMAAMWYVEDNMVIDEIRVIAGADGNQAINFHVMSYDMDISSNHGDLSSGTLLAHIGSSISATSTTIKTDTLTIDSSSVAAGKIVLAFAEAETGTDDISCQMTIKYHLS